MARRARAAKYPKTHLRIPTYLRARLQAAATVLGKPVHELIEEAVELHLESLGLAETERELIDRFASETLVRTEDD